jgi:hypothetical protein
MIPTQIHSHNLIVIPNEETAFVRTAVRTEPDEQEKRRATIGLGILTDARKPTMDRRVNGTR